MMGSNGRALLRGFAPRGRGVAWRHAGRRAGLGWTAVAISMICAVAMGAGATGASASQAAARAARTLSLQESGQLRLTSKKGFTLNERGSASGAISGPIYIHLRLVSDSRVTAEVNMYPSGGSLSGSGSASYRVEGAVARFSGTLSISRGSGKYARARASGLRFSGTIRRRDDAVAVALSGPLSY
jgi:hypothetical protein